MSVTEGCTLVYNVAETTLRRRRAGKLARRDCQPNSKKLTKLEEEVIIKAKYGICDEDVYNFNEAGFSIGKITTQLVVTALERRGRPKAIQLGGRELKKNTNRDPSSANNLGSRNSKEPGGVINRDISPLLEIDVFPRNPGARVGQCGIPNSTSCQPSQPAETNGNQVERAVGDT
ncbi:hypothetical protein yc1106_01917 [Curvularia clavata]|uniref:HTH psq-type domain-containing protein n=1 Tax=Curvularia clavata TaxID=95742 RepID=A0A9Q8Z686_CURCL|nr:hypothetical protein yc1106_01917 [Curvularia clavata]